MNLSLDRKRLEETLRKANSNCISIPPGQRGRYVWLNETLPEPRRGSIVFEAKASNDIHVCLHHDSSKTIFGKDGMKDLSSPEYEILYGGWMNSKSTIRKFCIQQIFVTKDMKKDVVIRTSSVFSKYWITIIEDTIYAGIGELGYNQILQWTDENSSRSPIKYIGVSSWSTPIQFKNFSITKPFIPDHQKFTFNGRYLLTSATLADTMILVNNQKFELHLPILHCWNPNFLDDLNRLVAEDEAQQKKQKEIKNNQLEEVKDLVDVNILNKLLNILYTGRIYSIDLQEIEEIISLSKRLNVKIDYLEQYYHSLVKEIQEKKRLIQLEQTKSKMKCNSVSMSHSLQQESTMQSESAQRLLEQRIMELSKALDLHNNNNNNNEQLLSEIDQVYDKDKENSPIISNEQQLGEVATNNIIVIEKKNEEEDTEMDSNPDFNTKVEKLNTALKEIAQWNDSSVIISRAIRFSDLYLNPNYCDVEFLFESENPSKSIFAHRAILSILSDPFLAMFSNHMKESTQKQIVLREVSFTPFSIFLEYCYKGHIEIPIDHVISLLILSDRFGINPLRESCFEIVNEYIDLENCCNLLDMANLYNWSTIKSNCFRFIESNFNRICEREEFLLMGPNTLIQLLLSDDLLVSDEYQVYSAAIKWIEYNCPGVAINQLTDEEYQLITDILSFVRLPLMNENSLLDIKQRYSSLLDLLPKVKNDLEEAVLYVQGPGDEIYNKTINSNEVALSIKTESDFRKRNRTANHFNELLFSSFGDKNGVFYFIGCAYGTKKIWENPHKANRVKITMSSPISRYTKPEILVNRSFISTNYTSGNPAWCKVDLTENHQLVCNYYTIRQDGSDCFIRSWILQGSNSDDEESWVNLRVHKKDKTLFQPSQYAGWSVFGKHSPYRYFRIITTGPSTGGGSGHKLAICNLELYGYFK